jgi:GTP-binding protein YchF
MLSLGIVGLPNAGKSSLFKALTRVSVLIANYPFTTIEPHHGVVAVPDERLQKLANLTPDNRVFPTAIKFVDIAGLIQGAHKGEGLGNQFLSHIRGVDGIVEVVRLFEDKAVAHPMQSVDPERDIKVINEELCWADLKILEQPQEEYRGAAQTGNKEAIKKLAAIKKVAEALRSGTSARDALLNFEERSLLREYNLLTLKPLIFVWNVSEAGAPNLPPEYLTKHGIALPIKLFADFAGLPAQADAPENELEALKKEFGIEQDALAILIRKAYEALGLITFFTVKSPETRAWAVRNGANLPEAGSAIHTDFRDKFIRAEVINIAELLKFNSWQTAKTAGKIRAEGRNYIVKDGDIIEFKI